MQQIIELSRLQDDDPLDSPEAVPLDELVTSTFDDVRTDADARRISLVHEPSGLVLLGRAGQIHLALSNLVANAVKYSAEGSTVVVDAKSEGALVELSVSDRGMGIPSSELDRIFERFYRVDRARPRRRAAPASACRSSSTWPPRTAARSPYAPSRVKGRRSP